MNRVLVVAASLVLAPRAALACPVCFGNSDSPLASATNLGILAMLGVVASVLSGFAAFIVHLNRRARLGEAQSATAGVPLTTSPQEGTAQC
jgi:hypothetical protein